MNEIFVKILDNNDIKVEIEKVGFDKSYIDAVKNKYQFITLKIFNLKSPAANILKQICLSVGADCAVHRDVITNKIEFSDVILACTKSQLKIISQKIKNQPFSLSVLSGQFDKILLCELSDLKIRNTVFNWSKSQYLMGILNITPDSFSDGGKYFSKDEAIKKALQLIEDGVDIIDIGGESTRPFAESVEVQEEQKRIFPIIEDLRKLDKNIVISVDTRNSDTAKKVLDLGADIINDVSFAEHDLNMLNVVKQYDAPYILTHSRKMSENDSAVDNVYKDFLEKLVEIENIGINKNKIIIDVGIGFGKTKVQNFELLKYIKDFTSLNYPILMGLSRKSFLPFDNEEDKDFASALAGFYSLEKNVNILRVHNVKLHKQMIDLKLQIGV